MNKSLSICFATVASFAISGAGVSSAAPLHPMAPIAAPAASDLGAIKVQDWRGGGGRHGGGGWNGGGGRPGGGWHGGGRPGGGWNNGGGGRWHRGGGRWHGGGGRWHGGGGWNGGGWNGGWYPGPYYRNYNNFGPVLGGFVAGAIIGGLATNSYQPGPNYYRGGYGNAHVQWCANRYRSYDVRTNTFQPYHGPRRICYSPY